MIYSETNVFNDNKKVLLQMFIKKIIPWKYYYFFYPIYQNITKDYSVRNIQKCIYVHLTGCIQNVCWLIRCGWLEKQHHQEESLETFLYQFYISKTGSSHFRSSTSDCSGICNLRSVCSRSLIEGVAEKHIGVGWVVQREGGSCILCPHFSATQSGRLA